MADLQTKNFDTLVAEQVATIQGSSSSLIDFTIGSILLSIVEAYAAIALWLQALVLKVLAITRAATSTGTDLDSWMADYGLVRLGATYATGQATFSRFTAGAQAVVPVGALIQTSDGAEQYAVTADSANAAYSAALSGYVIGAGITSVTVPIQAIVAGASGNAAIGAISVLAQAIAGVDSVTNAPPLANGTDAETDMALRARFVRYISSLSKATKGAVAYATTSVETNVSYTLVENHNYDGSARLGYFCVVVDDGSGEPSDDFLARVYSAVDAVRPVSVEFGVFAATRSSANVVLQIAVAAGYTSNAIAAIVQGAIATYIDGLALGATLSWSRLFQVAYDASPAVVSVSGLLINGGATDLPGDPKQVIKAGTISAATVS